MISPAAAAQGVFQNSLIGVGPNPNAITSGDLNADGFVDFVTADFSGSDISVGLGGPPGQAPIVGFLPVNGSPSDVRLVDFNNDGKLDAIVAAASVDKVSVMLGNGLGFLSNSLNISLLGDPRDLRIGDFNNDGKKDIAAASPTLSKVHVVLGDGAGFINGNLFFFAPAPFDDFTIGDVTQDGKLDAVVVSFSQQKFWIFGGFGNGSLGTPTAFSTNNTRGGAVEVTDLNHDSVAEIVVAGINKLTFKTQAEIFKQTTPGVFATNGIVAMAGGSVNHLVPADVNLDGNVDMISAGQYLTILLGDGAGGLGGVPPAGAIITTSGLSSSAATGDVNLDGKPDILAAFAGADGVRYYYGDGAGAFPEGIFKTTIKSDGGIYVRDANFDGKSDVLLSFWATSEVQTLAGDGAGALASNAIIPIGDAVIGFGDFNHDGFADAAAFDNSYTSLKIFPGNSGGTYGAPFIVGIGSSIASRFADFDLDGTLDFIFTSPTQVSTGDNSSIRVWRGDGAAGFSPFMIHGTTLFLENLISGDMNHDGAPDVVAGYYLGFATYLGGPGATLLPPVANRLQSAASPYFCSLADWNQDGNGDVTFKYTNVNGTVSFAGVCLGDGAGGAGPETTFGSAGAASLPLVADVNGDSYFDITIIEGAGGIVKTFLGGGYGAPAGLPVASTIDQGSLASDLGDLNSDGRLDILSIRDYPTAELQILLNETPGAPSAQSYGSGTAGCAGTLGISSSGAANLGSTNFTIFGAGAPPMMLGALLIGDAQDLAGGDPLFLNLMLHVDLFNSTQLSAGDIISNPFGEWALPIIAIPYDFALLQKNFYIQSIWFDPLCYKNPPRLSSSRGLKVTIVL